MTEDLGFHSKWVNPFYMRLMGLFSLEDVEKQKLVDDILNALDEIDQSTIILMLRHSNWRPRLTASYFVGFSKITSLSDTLGQCLLEHPDYAYPHFLALMRIDYSTAAPILREYLQQNLKLSDNKSHPMFALEHLSVKWALACLQVCDEQLNTDYYNQFEPLWAYFKNLNPERDLRFDKAVESMVNHNWSDEQIQNTKLAVQDFLAFARKHFD